MRKNKKIVTIENNWDLNFDFALKRSQHLNFISINPENGTVRKQEKIDSEIISVPISEYKLKLK